MEVVHTWMNHWYHSILPDCESSHYSNLVDKYIRGQITKQHLVCIAYKRIIKIQLFTIFQIYLQIFHWIGAFTTKGKATIVAIWRAIVIIIDIEITCRIMITFKRTFIMCYFSTSIMSFIDQICPIDCIIYIPIIWSKNIIFC